MKQVRPIYEIFVEAKSEMYKKLDELRKEYKPIVDEHITLNVLDFDDLHSVERTDYGDYDLGYIYISNYFKVKMIVQSISLKISIQVELNTKYMKGTWREYAYDIVNISKEEYNIIYAETQLKELTEFINKINKELNSDRLKGQIYYYIDSELIIRESKDLFCVIDNTYYELGNYFTDKEKAKETALKLKRFWNNIKEEKNTYIFRLSSNISQINNILYKVKQQDVLNRILKICEIADRRLIQFTIEKGNIDNETGVMIKFTQNLEIKNIKDIEYVEVGNDYIYAWVSTQNKYIFLNM